MAAAEAEQAARVGIAQAMAIDEQVRAYGGPQLQLTRQVMERFSEAIELARIDIVPKVMISGGAGATGGAAGTNGSDVRRRCSRCCCPTSSGDTAHTMPARDPRLDSVRDAIRDNLVATMTAPTAVIGTGTTPTPR